MAAKVFDAYGDLHVNTKKAEHDIKNVGKEFNGLEKAVERMNSRMSRFGDTMLHADRMATSMSQRVKRGFLTGMEASLQRSEGGLLALGNAFQVAGSGFRKTQNESALVLKSFQQLQRRGYVLQSVLGSLAGTIGDLSGGFLSLVGVLSQAAFAFAGVGGALVSVVAGFAVAKIAMSGVGKAVSQLYNGQNQYNRSLRDARKELKDLKFDLEGAVLSEQEAAIELEKARTQLAMAQDLPPDNMVRRESELAFQRADLNYRRAKSRVTDLQDTIKDGGTAAARAANADPFRGLTKSQISFTKYLVTLKPQLQALKEASASSFLPPLQTAIQTIVKTTFPTLMQGFNLLGSAMGYAANEFANVFKSEENINLLRDFFVNSAPSIKKMGESSGRFLAGFLGMLKAAQPLTDRFLMTVDTVSIKLETMSKSAQFSEFLRSAGYVASEIGKVFKSFSDGIGNIMAANFPPGGGGAGQVLLDFLKGVAKGFEEFTGSSTFPKWLKDTTTNATVAVGVMGDFLGIFIDLAGRPEVKLFFEGLAKSIPDITKILMDGLKAGPAFAEMLASVIKLFAIFSDSGALESFFSTLKIIADILVDLLTPFKPLLDIIGKFHGVILAVGLGIVVFNTVGVIFMAMLGSMFLIIGRIVRGFMQMGSGFNNVVKAGTRFNTVLATSERPMGMWGRNMTGFIRGMGNANRAMNRNATDYFSLIGKEKEYAALLKSKPTFLQRVTGSLKIYGQAMKEAMTTTTVKTAATKAGTAAEKAAGVAEKQRLSGSKLLKSSFTSLNASIKEYISVMRMKTDADKANATAVKTGIAVQNSANESIKKGSLINRMAGAGTRGRGYSGPGAMGVMGVGLAAEGLISGAANGGMTAGSALTALGGAAMFIPGGVYAGIGLGITGAIIQGFEAANRAEKEKQAQINAEKIQMQVDTANITTNKLNEKKNEFANLLGQKGVTYEKAVEIMNARSASITGAASAAGLGEGDAKLLDKFRLLLLDQGITEKSAGYKGLLTAGAGLAKTLSGRGELTDPEQLLAVLATFRGEGAGALSKYGKGGATAPQLRFVPGSNDTMVGMATEGQITNEKLFAYQQDKLPAIAKNIGTIEQLANIIRTNKSVNLATESVLGAAGKTRTDMSMTGAITAVDKTTAFKYLGDALKTGVFDTWIKANPSLAAQANPTYTSKVMGTLNSPLITSVKPDPAQLDALRLQTNNIARTATAMDLLKGAIVDGKLQVQDVNKGDNIAPILIAPPTASKEYKDWVQTANAQLVAAFSKGG